MSQTTEHLLSRYGSHYNESVLADIKFVTIIPPLELQPFIKHYWLASFSPGLPFRGNTYPDGACGLTFDLNSIKKGAFQGIMTSANNLEVKQPSHSLGVRFTIGGTSSFFADMSQFAQGHIALSDFAEFSLTQLHQQLIECSDDKARILKLNQYFTNRLIHLQPDILDTNLIVRKLMPKAEVRVDKVAEQLGVSQRQLNRLFAKHIGYTPKQITAILRTDVARRLLSQPVAINLQDVIYQLGYYDQAHFTKEFKQYTNTTPLKYLKKKRRQLWL